MAKISELKEKKSRLMHDIQYLLDKSILTTDESRKFDTMTSEIEKLSDDIAFEQKRFDMARKLAVGESPYQFSDAELLGLRQFSFVKFFREISSGTLTGIEMEMHEEGKREMQNEINQVNKGWCIPRKILAVSGMRVSIGQNITTAGDGGNLTKTLPVLYRDALKNALILPAMGATYLTGLTGELPIVRGGLFSATWAAEGTAVNSAKAVLGRQIMSAKRLTATGAFSNELLRQSSIDVENWVRMGLVDANAQAILAAVINGSSPAPTGILGTASIGDVAGGENGAAPSWSHLVALETQLASANADLGSLGYLTNAKVRGKLKQTLKASGVPGYVWENDQINGYKAASSNAVPSNLSKGNSGAVCSAIIFGNWSDLLIGEWGGLDIIVDPYSLKKQGEIEITVHTFADIAVAHPESFAAMKDALTN